jgi:hypothetical protein
MFLAQMAKFLGRWDVVGVREVAPMVVAYRPARCELQPELHRELLHSQHPDPTHLFSGAPNRDAVAYNLKQSVRGFEAAFIAHRKTVAELGLKHWRDLLGLNMAHATEADLHITNGQRTVTMLRHSDGRRSVALHANLDDFFSNYARTLSLVPGKAAWVSSDERAQTLATEWLSDFVSDRIPITENGVRGSMFWRIWGWARGIDGYRKFGLLLTCSERQAWCELEPWAGAEFEPYAVLQRLSAMFPGVEADTCATCKHFGFSGMGRDMSGGNVGYCLAPARQAVDRRPPTVAVSNRCDGHTFVRDTERTKPFLR